MPRVHFTAWALASLILLPGFAAPVAAQSDAAKQDDKKSEAAKDPEIYAVGQYDPKRDAKQDLATTIKRARKDGKHIILEIGGTW